MSAQCECGLVNAPAFGIEEGLPAVVMEMM